MTVQDLLEFSKLLTAFGKVERSAILVPGTERKENDVDHSYSLAMLAWYIVSGDRLPLDLNKVIQYALAHDLVEVYAGDTYAYSRDTSHTNSKHEREAHAAKRIAEEFPQFPELHATILEYEKRKDAESKFVYALDKIVPFFLNYEDKGRSWRRNGITLKMFIDHKKDKIDVSPEIKQYFTEIIALASEHEEELFGSKAL